MRKTEQAEADREEKGKPYRDDPLFMYLWERGYGTSAYKAGNLIAWLDGLVARHGRLPQGAAELRDARTRSRCGCASTPSGRRRTPRRRGASSTALETAAIDAAGGKPVREALERGASADRRDRRRQWSPPRTSATRRSRSSASWRRAATRNSRRRSPALGEALGREDLKALLAEARLTRTAQDDTIIQQIDDARQRAAEEEARDQGPEAAAQGAGRPAARARGHPVRVQEVALRRSALDLPRGQSRGRPAHRFPARRHHAPSNYWDQWRQSQNWAGGYQPGPWEGASAARRR